MRTKPYELECLRIWLTVDQHKVRSEMTVPVIDPIARQSVIPMARLQHLVLG